MSARPSVSERWGFVWERAAVRAVGGGGSLGRVKFCLGAAGGGVDCLMGVGFVAGGLLGEEAVDGGLFAVFTTAEMGVLEKGRRAALEGCFARDSLRLEIDDWDDCWQLLKSR